MGLMHDIWKKFAGKPIPPRLGKTLEEVFYGTPLLQNQELLQDRVRGERISMIVIDEISNIGLRWQIFLPATPRDNTEANR